MQNAGYACSGSMLAASIPRMHALGQFLQLQRSLVPQHTCAKQEHSENTSLSLGTPLSDCTPARHSISLDHWYSRNESFTVYNPVSSFGCTELFHKLTHYAQEARCCSLDPWHTCVQQVRHERNIHILWLGMVYSLHHAMCRHSKSLVPRKISEDHPRSFLMEGNVTFVACPRQRPTDLCLLLSLTWTQSQ